MRQNRILIDHYPYTFVLKACASVRWLIHGNGSISFYCNRGKIASAPKLDDVSRFKDSVRGCKSEARNLFDAMPEWDAFFLTILINGHGTRTYRAGIPWSMGSVGLGTISPAKELFDKMPPKKCEKLGILAHGYLHHGDAKQTLELFQVPMDGRRWSQS